MSNYRTTHPWLTFQLNLGKFPWEFWLLSGEAMSKCDGLAGAMLHPDDAKEMMRIYLVKGVKATTAIEGNTLTEEQVRDRIEGRRKLPASKEYLGVEIDNVVDVCNEILERYQQGDLGPLNPEQICDFNRRILQNLKLDEHIQPGKYRSYSVGVAGYRGAPAEHLRELMATLCQWLDRDWIPKPESLRDRDHQRLEAVLKAVIAHLYLAWIHPFGDGNGRTARLVELFILVRGGVPMPAAHLLSNHYNDTRAEYYRQLDRASKSGGDVVPLCLYALRGLVDGLREQLDVVRQRQRRVAWRDYVHEQLGDSETARRRRELLLDLAAANTPVPKAGIPELSVRVLRLYSKKSDKTLSRDLAELEQRGLIERIGDRYRARVEIVLAYLPPKTDSPAERGEPSP